MNLSFVKRLFRPRNIFPVIGISLFIVALMVLRNEIQQFSWSTFREHIRLMPDYQLFLAFGITAINYFILTFYDKLALINLGIRLPWYKSAKASFLGFAFSHNITPSLLVGGTIRYRVYSSMGVSGFNVTKIVGFCAVTLFLGFMALGGVVFIATPLSLPESAGWNLPDLQILGWIFVVAITVYLILCRTVRATIAFRNKLFSLPTLPVATGQLLVASMDIFTSSLILFLLLPPIDGLTYPMFLSIYMIGFIGGILSQVPGGLGVIETIMVLMLGAFIDPTHILSAVLTYRLFYFIIPLLAAAILLVIHEIRQRRKRKKNSESP